MTAKKALLAILSDRVIAYHVTFARVGGGATAGLFLSQLFYWTGKGAKADGWIWKSAREMEEETGLTKNEQRTARKRLRERGLIEEKLAGIPATVHYRIDIDKLIELVSQLVKYAQQDGTKAANYSESTTETTRHVATATPAPADAKDDHIDGYILGLPIVKSANCTQCGYDEIVTQLTNGLCDNCYGGMVDEANHENEVFDAAVKSCNRCGKLGATTADMPDVHNVCTCEQEATLSEHFGDPPERAPQKQVEHWTVQAAQAWAQWGIESDEFQRQLQRFGESGRIVQELGYKLEQATGIRPLWSDRQKVKSWSSGLWELYEESDHSIPTAIEAARTMRESKLTIATPYSVVKQAAALAASKRVEKRDNNGKPALYSDEWYTQQMENDPQYGAFDG